MLDAALDGPDQRALTAAAFDLSDETRAQLAALSDDPRWQRLVTRIRPGPPPSGSLGARLQQLLAPRRRLAFDPNQIELVDEVLERFRPRITGAGALVVDISNQVALPM